MTAGGASPAAAGRKSPAAGALRSSGAADKAILAFLPGNMCDERMWAGLPRRMEEAGFRSCAVDLSSEFSIADMADHALASVPSGQIVPIGFSMGAIVALQMAMRAPERLAGLVLIALNAAADLPERSVLRPRQQERAKSGKLAQVVGEELKPKYFAQANRGNPQLMNLTMQMARDLGPDVFVRQSEALRKRPDLRPALRTLRVPTLLLCGAEDALCPPEWHRAWAERIGPRATLEVIGNAGHFVPLERPRETAAALELWLSRVEKNA